ncbi:GLUG motif-containing protein [Acinetobacter bereziniae]|uniref:two-partner secretion domain-containing protein n=1 Tax=Acinetobacter bereziniae TaxID=106648 RepID=UPI0018DE7244|nr:GLUG motif-containing protein [Acinetobacter bereziniae]MBI0393153.1 filamentous hemagglutinin N-terminal domain-containing protein [Acinetobacter bereziniae]
MNKCYRIIWNKKYFCWQVVSELAKGTTAIQQSPTEVKSNGVVGTIAKKIGFLTANLLSASIAFAGPTGGIVSSGNATISTTGTTTTINQSTAKAAIDWSSFSSNSSEAINFVQPNSSSVTLNRVTGTSASTLNGQLNANGQVFIINPNGVLFGNTSQVNTAGLIASTLDLTNSDFNNNIFRLGNSTNNKAVENRGKITVPVGGTVALIASNIKQTGTIKAPQGNVLVAAGGDITLNLNNGNLLGYTINQGKAQALINSGGMIQADGGRVVLTAKGIDELSKAVVNSVGVIQAQTVNNVRGVIELGSDLTSGSLNVSGTLDASAPISGNGGKIKTTASNVQVNNGTNITTQRNATSSLPPTTSGWELKAKNIDVDFFGSGGASSAALSNALNKGNVTLSAVGTGDGQGVINLNDTTVWNANTALTLNANKDINFNSDLELSGDKAKLAMSFGISSDYNLNNGSKINISGSAPTLLINGTSYIVINALGEEGDASINTLQGMKNNLSGNYALGSSIDASDTVNWNDGRGFDPIGELKIFTDFPNSKFEIIERPFTGQFHGLGHTVNELDINLYKDIPMIARLSEPFSMIAAGMFGNASSMLRDIGIVDAKIKGLTAAGGLVANLQQGIIKNAYVSNINITGDNFVGGLIGAIQSVEKESQVINTYATGEVNGSSSTGGLIGEARNTTVKGSYANVAINSTKSPFDLYGAIGGLIGGAYDANIINSSAGGNVVGGSFVGGLVGSLWVNNSKPYTIENSYATGNVLAKEQAGGLIGVIFTDYINPINLNINHNYANGDVVALSSYGDAGGLIGLVNSNPNSIMNISNSYATGNVTADLGNNVGGLVGSLSGNIYNSYATGMVIGGSSVGGLVGHVSLRGDSLPEITIQSSYATGNVIGTSFVGGIIGYNNNYNFYFDQNRLSNFVDIYSSGNVTGNTSVGGLIGQNYGGRLTNSYANGFVNGFNQTGGLIGYNQGGTFTTNSYWNIETSGQLTSAGGIGKTTAELQKIMTFTDWNIADISDPTSNSIWVIDEDNKTPWLRYNN